MSLGGVRDEAEIRGHRRTYIGSMPGKILQNMTKVGVKNPLFLLDEVDKMGMDFRGDPSSALLEVLDPEQNHTFVDHYVEVEYDLSEVMFVATANTLNIPPPLLDRMEVIRLSGYTEDEKVNIASRYLLPKQLQDQRPQGRRAHGHRERDPRHRALLHARSRRARLERELSKICRKVVKQLLTEGRAKAKQGHASHAQNLDKYLGVRTLHLRHRREAEPGRPGHRSRLDRSRRRAADHRGGRPCPARARPITTGKLGEVMQESIQAALSVVRSRCAQARRDRGLLPEERHPHPPARGRDAEGRPERRHRHRTAMVSVLTGIPVRADVAMTGEITLRGEVLPIGGLKEKLLAAHRGGIKTVLIPEENVKDLAEIPDNIKNRLEIIPVKWIDQVLERRARAPARAARGERGRARGATGPRASSR